ncbi:hypothetical protein F4808DRAFT_18659 [Astrocystis sublimbata]|nr:hypothetical protein F4808DRAFT_18659 [Astrocystis sublimbata]
MAPSAATVADGNATPNPQSTLAPGFYVPTVAFFTPEDTVDEPTTCRHAVRLAKAGVTGIVTHGSNGEAVHLDHQERILITKLTRSALDDAGYASMPLIVGCGAQSTREAIKLCKDAAASGGTHTLVLPPAYYGGLLTTDLIKAHFREVADASPIPILIYNYPGACSGLDLSSDVVLDLAKHPNIQGVKFTCGNTGKLARVVAGTSDTGFRTFGGSADFTVQTLAVGGHGIIGGLGNVSPVACMEVIKAWEAGKQDRAQELQRVVARGDWTAIQGGFVSVKVALTKYFGYGGEPRKPCALPQGAKLAEQEEGFAELVELEKSLAK